MNMFDFLSLKDDKIAIFAGAGISRDSGLPLANELKKSILSNLMEKQEDIEEIMHSEMPFEFFVQNLTDNKNEKIFKIFKYGEPNTNHILIAKLAKLGIVKTILTTNFDHLFEKALKNEGLDFFTYYADEDFSNVLLQNIENRINLFKIHGSIDDYKSLKNTLNSVGQGLTPDKINIMDYVFSDGPHNKVIVLGYSCSDKFDVNPYLQGLKNRNKKVIFVQHENFNDIISTELTKVNDNNPFYDFDGNIIKCNTRVFMEKFWKIYEEEIGNFVNAKGALNWETHLKSWKIIISSNGVREAIAGQLFNSISNFKKSRKYYMKALQIVEKKKFHYGIYACHNGLGLIDFKQQKIDEALSHFNKALKAVNISGDGLNLRLEKAACYGNLGNLHLHVKNYAQAMIYYNLALDIYKLENSDEEFKIYMALDKCRELEDSDNVLKNINKSLEMRINNGDLIGIASCNANLGTYYNKINEPLKSIECNKKAIECFKELGMNNEVGQCYANLSKSYNLLKQVKTELKCLKAAEEIFIQVENLVNLGIILGHILNFAFHEKDHKLMKEYEEKRNIVNSGKLYSLNN